MLNTLEQPNIPGRGGPEQPNSPETRKKPMSATQNKSQTQQPSQKVNSGTSMNRTANGKAASPPPSYVQSAQQKVAAAAKAASAPPPMSYHKGGKVIQTGPARVEKGEVVFTKDDAKHLKKTHDVLAKMFRKK